MSAPDGKSRSVALVAEKARVERVRRLKMTLETRLDNAMAAIDMLMAELAEGEPQVDLWEQLHIAAARDKQETAVADAYTRCASGPRMKRLPPQAQADVLMHAADFSQGVLGDAAAAESFLTRVLAIVPGHVDAYGRLERRLEKLLDARRILELYATVAAAPPKPVNVLATQAFNRVLQLTPKDPLSEEACKQLIALVPTNSRLLDALETHCRATKRAPLAAALYEKALAEDTAAAVALDTQRRHRLLELYMGEAATPAQALAHVEALLTRDPHDATAFKVAERLLATPDVASPAAAVLSAARRARG